MAASTPLPTNNSSTCDLTSLISPFLDLHMLFPLLEFSSSQYPTEVKTIAESRLELSKSTNMVDYAIDIYKEVVPDAKVPAEFEDKKKEVFKKLETLTLASKLLTELTDDRKLELIEKGLWNMSGLASVGINQGIVESYRSLAKFNYECGDYETCRSMLFSIISLSVETTTLKREAAGLAVPPPATSNEGDDDEKKDDKKKPQQVQCYGLQHITASLLSSLWGILSCEILLENWDPSLIALNSVKFGIEYRAAPQASSDRGPYANSSNSGEPLAPPLESLQQRTYLLHWSLFVSWNHSRAADQIIDLFTTPSYMQAIQINSPHLLRYLSAAIIINKRRRSNISLKELVKVIQAVSTNEDGNDNGNGDPIVKLVSHMNGTHDFKKAQVCLAKCEGVLKADFFLCKQSNVFMDEARLSLFESFCRIHKSISLKSLSMSLSLSEDDAERWIVDLIRNASLDAKIDDHTGCVIMGSEGGSVWKEVCFKTRDLSFRSQGLVTTLAGVVKDGKKEKDKRLEKERGGDDDRD